tara:strand:+ start:66 stop:278 length:213 start_codon:yes stop_codon:yes gene_type:complete
MNKNQVKGHTGEAKGKVKEIVGKVTGDKSMEYKGKAEKFVGKTQAAFGDLQSDHEKAKDETQAKSEAGKS